MDMSKLNEYQLEAVTTIDGPVAVVACAGSGKTHCLTHRIAYLIENGVDPNRILAITFTNKAAEEIKSRVKKVVGKDISWIGTFHGIALRLLKQYANACGYNKDFVIYDDNDTKTLIRNIVKNSDDVNIQSLDIDYIIDRISKYKAHLIPPSDAIINATDDKDKLVAKIYLEYNTKLREYNAMDFDDLIYNICILMRDNFGIRRNIQKSFDYILCDEVQDSNNTQFLFLQLLSEKHNNIFLVGDLDQSIYGFRYANFRNFYNFINNYESVKTIQMPLNYRSNPNIVYASNAVINNNKERIEKESIPYKTDGDKIKIAFFRTQNEEVNYVTSLIIKLLDAGYSFSDIAILYRAKYQSTAVEKNFIRYGIPYTIRGGLSISERKEIKDMMAMLKFIVNDKDLISFQRIVNVPKRGIGDSTVAKISKCVTKDGPGLLEILKNIDDYVKVNKKTKEGINSFVTFMSNIKELAENHQYRNIHDVLVKLYTDSGYCDMLREEDTTDTQERMDNIENLIYLASAYESDDKTIADFIQSISIDTEDDITEQDKVNLMTVHASKGLEFPVVIIIGANEKVFPIIMPDTDIEEERRLFYVAMTRAIEKLYITGSYLTFFNDRVIEQEVSRFVKEIPSEYAEYYNVYKE